MSDRQKRRQLEEVEDEEAIRRRQQALFSQRSPLLQQTSGTQQASGSRSRTIEESPWTSSPRFSEPYSSIAPFGSPSSIGSDSFTDTFNSPYGSRQEFSSPNPTFGPPAGRRQRHPAGNIRPRDLSEEFSSGLSLVSDVPTQMGSGGVSAQQQTEPSVRRKTGSRAAAQSTRPQQSSVPSSYDPLATYDPYLSSYMSTSSRSASQSIPPTDSNRGYSTGDTSSVSNLSDTSDLDDYFVMKPPPPSAHKIKPLKPTDSNRRYSTGDISSVSNLSDSSDLDDYFAMKPPPPSAHKIKPLKPIGSNEPRTSTQTEPSVRPKVRTPMQPLGSSPPRIDNRIPEPDIVYEYSHPITGRPGSKKFGEKHQFMSQSDDTALNLANISRHQTKGIVNKMHGKRRRQRKYLESRGFEATDYADRNKKSVTRYESSAPAPIRSDRPHLVPRLPRDAANLTDPRFNKPLKRQDKKSQANALAPTGRQGFGPFTRRAFSMPDLTSTEFDQREPTHLEQFGERYDRLKPKHKNYYQNFRDQLNWNNYSSSRKVKAPTLMTISDSDKSRLDQIKERRYDQLSPIHNTRSTDSSARAQRRQELAQSSILPTAIEDEEQANWLYSQYSQSIPEGEEPEEEDDY